MSRTERPRKTKIGTEVSYVTRDSDTTFKVKRSQGRGILWRPLAQLVSIKVACLCEVYCDDVHFQEAFLMLVESCEHDNFVDIPLIQKHIAPKQSLCVHNSLGLSMYTERAFFLWNIYIILILYILQLFSIVIPGSGEDYAMLIV